MCVCVYVRVGWVCVRVGWVCMGEFSEWLDRWFWLDEALNNNKKTNKL